MIMEPECHKRKCGHFIGVKNDGSELTEHVYCKAFPNQIPDKIAYGKNKHLTILPEQKNNIVFENNLKKSFPTTSPQLEKLLQEELSKSLKSPEEIKLLKEKRKRRKKRQKKR